MQKSSDFFSDLTKMMTSAGGTLLELRKEVEGMVSAQMEKWAGKMNMVTRDEFEAVRAMAQTAREENEALKIRLETLEALAPQKTVASAKAAAAAKTTKKA